MPTSERTRLWCRVCCLALVVLAVGVRDAAADIINIVGDPGDSGVDVDGTLYPPNAFDGFRVGTGGNNDRGEAGVFFFALPTLSSPAALVSAQLDLSYLGLTTGSPGIWVTPNYNVDLFGLGARATPTVLSTDYEDGSQALSLNTLIAPAIITPTTAPGTVQASGVSLLDFLTSLYNPDGTPIADYAVFRINASIHLPVGSGQLSGYDIAAADYADPALRPDLTLTVNSVPGPSSLAMLGGFAIVVAGYCGVGWRLRNKPLPG